MNSKFIKYKIIIKALIFSSALYITGLSYADGYAKNFKLMPYIGLESGTQYFGFKQGYGDNLFEKQLPKINIFIGMKFNDHFGIESGYETTNQGEKNVTLYKDSQYLGEKNIGLYVGESAKYYTLVKISGWHIGLTSEYKFKSSSSKNSLALISYVGIKNTKIKLTSHLVSFGPLRRGGPTNLLNQNNKKILLKLSLGLQYLPFENFGFRVTSSFENTSNLEPDNYKKSLKAKLENSISHSIGIIFIK